MPTSNKGKSFVKPNALLVTLRTLLAYCLAPLGHRFAAVRPNRQPLAVPKASPGFTVIELVTALVIAGVLGTLAVPRYHSTVVNARRGEAKANLSHISSLQAVYRIEHDFSSFTGLSVGYVSTDADSCTNDVTKPGVGLRNALGFRPEGCDSLRYGYTTSGGSAVAYGPSDAPDRWIYPDCAGSSGGTQCGQTQGDVVRIAANSTKADVCRDIIEFCPGGGTVPPPCPPPHPTCSPGQTFNTTTCACETPTCPASTTSSSTTWNPVVTSNTCPGNTVPQTGTITTTTTTYGPPPSCPGSSSSSSSSTSRPAGGTKTCTGACETCDTGTNSCASTIPVCNACETPDTGTCSCVANLPSCTGYTCTAPLVAITPAPTLTCGDTPSDATCCRGCDETTCTLWLPDISGKCGQVTQSRSCTDPLCSTTQTIPGPTVCDATCQDCVSNSCQDKSPLPPTCSSTCAAEPQAIKNQCAASSGTWDDSETDLSKCCKTCAAYFTQSDCTDTNNPHYDAAKPHYDSAGTYPNCCVSDCSTFSCNAGFTLKPNASSIKSPQPLTNAICCDVLPDCSTFSCNTGYTLKLNASSITGPQPLTNTTCCDPTCDVLTPVQAGTDCQTVGTDPACCPDGDPNTIALICQTHTDPNKNNKCCPTDPADLPNYVGATCTIACGCATGFTCDTVLGTCVPDINCSAIAPGTLCNNNSNFSVGDPDNPSPTDRYAPSRIQDNPCCREGTPEDSGNKLECQELLLFMEGQCCYTLAGNEASCVGGGCCADGLKCKSGTCCPYPLPGTDGDSCSTTCGCDTRFNCVVDADPADPANPDTICCPNPLPSRGKPCIDNCGCYNNPDPNYNLTCKDMAGDSWCCLNPLPGSSGDTCVSSCGCTNSLLCKSVDGPSHPGVCCPVTANLPDHIGASCHYSCGCASGYRCENVDTSTGFGLCAQVINCTPVAAGLSCNDTTGHPSGIVGDSCCTAASPMMACETTGDGKECCDSLVSEGGDCSLGSHRGCCNPGFNCLTGPGPNGSVDLNALDICQTTSFNAEPPDFSPRTLHCLSNRLTPDMVNVINACAKVNRLRSAQFTYHDGQGGDIHTCEALEHVFEPGNYWLSYDPAISINGADYNFRCRDVLEDIFIYYGRNTHSIDPDTTTYRFKIHDINGTEHTIGDWGINTGSCSGASISCDPYTPN